MFSGAGGMLASPITNAFAGASDEDAASGFEQTLQAHERRVLAVAFRLTGNMEDAKDIAQEAFLRLHRSLARVEPSGAGAWLYRITVNLCEDHRRTKWRRVSEPIGPLEGVLRAASSDPEADASRNEDRDRIGKALLLLGDKERAALVLRDMEGLSTAKVAEILGSTESTVRVQISKARLKLRKILRGTL